MSVPNDHSIMSALFRDATFIEGHHEWKETPDGDPDDVYFKHNTTLKSVMKRCGKCGNMALSRTTYSYSGDPDSRIKASVGWEHFPAGIMEKWKMEKSKNQ